LRCSASLRSRSPAAGARVRSIRRRRLRLPGEKAPPTADKSAAIGPDGKPIAPANPNKRFILDGILN